MLKFDFKDKQQLYQFIVGIAGVVLIGIGCLVILQPFFAATLLAVIFALSAWPAFEWLKVKLNYRTPLAALCTTLMLAMLFIMPLVLIGTSSSENFTQAYTAVQNTLKGRNLSEMSSVLNDVPVVGKHMAKYWTDFTSDKERMTAIMQEYAGPTSQSLLKLGGTIGHGLFDLTLGIIIAYFFFRHGTHVAVRIRTLSDKFAGEKGRQMLDVTKTTLIGVVYGILGTALAQGALSAVGFLIAGVPGATFLGLICFFLSLIPMGPPLVWIPAAYWLYTEGNVGSAIFLVVWGTVVVGAVDNILKPYFISRGSNLPFMLVLFGVGGGVLAFGFIGLFIGPTILALAYSIILELSTARALEKPPAEQKLESAT